MSVQYQFLPTPWNAWQWYDFSNLSAPKHCRWIRYENFDTQIERMDPVASHCFFESNLISRANFNNVLCTCTFVSKPRILKIKQLYFYLNTNVRESSLFIFNLFIFIINTSKCSHRYVGGILVFHRWRRIQEILWKMSATLKRLQTV